MTVLLIAAAYLTIAIVTARKAYQRIAAHDSDLGLHEAQDRLMGGLDALLIGVFWPIALTGLLLISIITWPGKGDTQ